jgi:2-methylcitrate dehydratase PrpD
MNEKGQRPNGNHAAVEFITTANYAGLPGEVNDQAKRCLLDVLGATLAGAATPVGRIVSAFAAQGYRGEEATILLADSQASLAGATLANAVMANALDVDDGYRLVKGHPGAVVFPAALAAAEMVGASGSELLEALVIGYEVAIRAGLILHSTYRTFHCSGNWGSVGAAASTAKLLRLRNNEVHHALGIAEYHAPMAPVMRDVDSPAMVKAAIGWGSMGGVSAALLAQRGFTGIPSLLGSAGHEELVATLGSEFKVMGLYFKPYACCRWAQPAVDGVLRLIHQHSIATEQIAAIKVHTFDAATRLKVRKPRNTEEAQFSLAFPVAAAVVDGQVGPCQVLEKLTDPRILAVAEKVEAVLSPELEQAFPGRCLSDVEIRTDDGQRWRSGVIGARGDPDNPLSDEQLREKFRSLAGYVLPEKRVEALLDQVDRIEEVEDVNALVELLRSR